MSICSFVSKGRQGPPGGPGGQGPPGSVGPAGKDGQKGAIGEEHACKNEHLNEIGLCRLPVGQLASFNSSTLVFRQSSTAF